MNRPVQYFSAEYLSHCRTMGPEKILRFLEDFRLLHGRKAKPASRLISLRVPEPLLEAFKTKSRLHNIPYQAQIKRLMARWIP